MDRLEETPTRTESGFQMQSLLREAGQEECRAKTPIYLLLPFVCLFMQKIYMRYRDEVEKQGGKITVC